MSEKVSGFMIKGKLPQSACEILYMCDVLPIFTDEDLEPNEFKAEAEYERIKGRATRYEIREPNQIYWKKRKSALEIIVRQLGDWTLCWRNGRSSASS
jgi:hypothetical protein